MKTSLSTKQFKSVLNKSTVQTINNLQFYYHFSNHPKIGFIISRKLGPAVERNFFKRRCRALFLEACNQINKNFSLIVWPKNNLLKTINIDEVFSVLNKKIKND